MTANPTQGAEPDWVLVPRTEMTDAMIDAGQRYLDSRTLSLSQRFNLLPATFNWHEFYAAMLSAAPPPPVNASAIDAWKAAEEIVDRITEPATHKHAVGLVAAIILRHSAAPGLRLTGWRDISDEAKNGKDSAMVEREFGFDRYVRGRLMAEGVVVHARTESEARAKARALYSSHPGYHETAFKLRPSV